MCLYFDKKEALSYENLGVNMLSVSPDDAPVIGNLKQYPNIFLNVGHGQRQSSLAFISGKLISDAIDGQD